MQKPENIRNPTRPEIFGFPQVWPEKPEILWSETWPDRDPNFRVRVFSRVPRVSRTTLHTLPTVKEVWKFLLLLTESVRALAWLLGRLGSTVFWLCCARVIKPSCSGQFLASISYSTTLLLQLPWHSERGEKNFASKKLLLFSCLFSCIIQMYLQT